MRLTEPERTPHMTSPAAQDHDALAETLRRLLAESEGALRPGQLRLKLESALSPDDVRRLRPVLHQLVAAAEENLPANLTQAPIYFGILTVLLLATSILMTWVCNRTGGSLPLVALTHASMDTMTLASPLSETGTPVVAYALVAAAMWLVTGLLVRYAGPDPAAGRAPDATR